MAQKILAALAVLVLSACGGGGSSDPACVPQQTITVSILGNSIASGLGDDPTLRSMLFAQFGPGVSVVNHAVGGTEVSDIIIGRAGFKSWPQDAGDVTLVLDGTNEAIRGSSLAQFSADLGTITKRPGVVLIAPPPMDQTIPLTHGADILPYVQAVRGAKAPADLYAYMMAIQGWQSDLRDGVHPVDPFYAVLSKEVVYPAVAREVSKLRCQ